MVIIKCIITHGNVRVVREVDCFDENGQFGDIIAVLDYGFDVDFGLLSLVGVEGIGVD